MYLMGKFMRNLISPELPPDSVQEVNFSAYTGIPVVAREEGLILHGPTRDGKYELLLQQPIDANCRTAYSLFRLANQQSAQERFIRLREVMAPLLTVDPACYDLYNQRCLQELLNMLRDNPTWQAAHIAAKQGNLDLLTLPAVATYCNTAELEQRLTPLHIAVQEQRLPVIRALLQMDVSTDATDVKGNSVYHLAAVSNKQIIELVTQGPRCLLLDAPNNAGHTPLHLACIADKPDCVTALLLAGANVNVATTQDSSLAIHTAMAADSRTCAKEILSRHPNMLHVQDMKHGGTPVHWAKSREMIGSLVEFGCQINAKNFDGRTALHLMTAHDRLGCVIALLSHGALPHITDNEGNTALHMVRSVPILHALVVFEAPLDAQNNKIAASAL